MSRYLLRKLQLSSDSSSDSEIENTARRLSHISIDSGSDDDDDDNQTDKLTEEDNKNPQPVMPINVSQALKLIPEFSGNPKELNRFLKTGDVVFKNINDADIEFLLNAFIIRLSEKAFEIISRKEYQSWNELKGELKANFSDTRTIEQLQHELMNMRQGANESVREFGNRVEETQNLLISITIDKEGAAAADIVRNMHARTARKAFEEGLLEPLRLIVKACRFPELSQAISKACEEESIQNERNLNSKSNSSSQPTKCQLCSRNGHTARSCFQNTNNALSPSTSSSNPTANANRPFVRLICAYCKRPGHHIQQCFKKQRADQRTQSTPHESQDNQSADFPTDTKNDNGAERDQPTTVRAQNLK